MNTRTIALGVIGYWMSLAIPAYAASVQTRNFIVEAPTPELAQEFGQLAEGFRKSKALEWLGREMPAWPQKCPLRVTVQGSGAGGATSFNFTNGQVFQTMHIEGALDRLRHSVLPHEVTHTVFAHHFRQPVPRWADEGGSVLSEDDLERQRHDTMCRQLLNAGRGMQLQVLFNLKDYPRDVMVLYAQGYSITRYLVDLNGRAHFLNFIGHGMRNGWDAACQQYYQIETVQQLEQAWLNSLRRPRTAVVQNEREERTPSMTTGQVATKEFYQPSLPNLDPPIVARGVAPSPTDGAWNQSPVRLGAPEPTRPVVNRSSPPVVISAPQPRIQEASRTSSGPPIVLFPPEPFPTR